MGRVGTVLIIEWIILPLILAALLASILLAVFSIETFMAVIEGGYDPNFGEYELGASIGMGLALIFTMWAAMLIFHGIGLYVLKTGISNKSFIRLKVWVIYQSILTAAGIVILVLTGLVMKVGWWWFLVNTITYIYRICAIHIIRVYYAQLRATKTCGS